MCYHYKYPPLIAAVRNSDGNITGYKGFCADFINTFAEHFEMRYIYITVMIIDNIWYNYPTQNHIKSVDRSLK